MPGFQAAHRSAILPSAIRKITMAASSAGWPVGGRLVESGSHRDLLRAGGLYADLYNEQFEGGRVQWSCEGGDVMADGSVRKWEKQPA